MPMLYSGTPDEAGHTHVVHSGIPDEAGHTHVVQWNT